MSQRHCEELLRRSNPPFRLLRYGLLRFARNDGINRDRQGMRSELPSLHAPLRVVGRGRGWGAPPRKPLLQCMPHHPHPRPLPTAARGEGRRRSNPSFRLRRHALLRLASDDFKTPYSRHRSQNNPRCDTNSPCSSDKPRCRRNRRVRRTAAPESAALRWRRICRWP